MVLFSKKMTSAVASALLVAGATPALVSSATIDVTLIAAYEVANIDGSFLRVPLFNGTFPGPPIECLEGDLLRINVINDMKKEEMSVHWHAMNVANHMDGVPYVTENPISPGGTSRIYDVTADAAGTFQYYASQEFLRSSLHGIIIVKERNPGSDFIFKEFGEYEDLIAIQSASSSLPSYPALVAADVYHKDSATLASQLDNGIGDWIWQPQSMVVNGWGMHDCSVNYEQPYYFRCTWQCPSEDTKCIDEVRCSKATHPFNGNVLGPYVWEEQGSNDLYNELIASNPGLYTNTVQTEWANECGWDHIAPFLYGSSNEREADGHPIGATGVHQNQFLNWGRPTGTRCDLPDSKSRDPRCLVDGTWPFKGLNKARTYDHLRTENGVYNVTHFDQNDLNTHNASCRATRFYTGDAQPESNHYPFGLYGQSHLKCDDYPQSVKKSESPAVFEVEAGKMYRLRAVNIASLLYPTLVIEGHNMIVVQIDGSYVEPFETNFLDLWNGQTYSVLIKANAEMQGDFWIGLGIRHRGYTRMDPGRAILRYITKDPVSGETSPVASVEERLPMDKSRPVPKWWDAASQGQYNNVESGNKPKACPMILHPTIYDTDRDLGQCPGFYPHFTDQDISMELQYKFRSRKGMYQLPSLTNPDHNPVSIVQNMNVNGYSDIDTLNACASDYGNSNVGGTYVNAYSYASFLGDKMWAPLYSRFRPGTNIAGKDKKLCGVQRWSVNNITIPSRYTRKMPEENGGGGRKKALLEHAYDGTLQELEHVVDVRRADETEYFSTTPEGFYSSIDPNELGGNTKMSLGISPASNELYNIIQFDNGEVFDIVMQNTVYLKYWTNALYGNKHNHRSGSNHHPYHSHGFKLWTLGYGEGNFDGTAWNFADSVSSESDVIEYTGGIVLYKNLENPPIGNLAVNFAGGWTVLRVQADKPGLWLFHCTVMSHYYMGMGTTFGFGLNEGLPKPNPFSKGNENAKAAVSSAMSSSLMSTMTILAAGIIAIALN